MRQHSYHTVTLLKTSRRSPLSWAPLQSESHHDSLTRRRSKHSFVPQKAAVHLTEAARTFFQKLLEKPPRPDIVGIMLHYTQSKKHGDLRMVFSFDFVTQQDITPQDEPVSLDVLEDGVTPKPFLDSLHDGRPKLYVHAGAFLKVLGATVDVDPERLTPVLYDREGHRMDPNA